jgi:hypothetical protein
MKNGIWKRRLTVENVKRETGGVPILSFGKGNNFHQFKQALSVVSLKDFGNLGKRILKGSYFIPENYNCNSQCANTGIIERASEVSRKDET